MNLYVKQLAYIPISDLYRLITNVISDFPQVTVWTTLVLAYYKY